ncbi:MAG: hypothetical protein ACI4UE_06470 [Candidatus Scatovivens sp.]
MTKNYIIKIWETESEREQGLSEIIKVGIDKLEIAIEEARRISEDNEYACIEVQDSKQKKSYLTIDEKGEKIDNFNYIDAIRQEKINYFYNLVYGEEDIVYKDESTIGKASKVLEVLKENEKEMYKDFEEEKIILEEHKDLLKDIEEYDDNDIIKIYEHPMAVVPMIDSNKETLEDITTEFLDLIEEEVLEYEIQDVVDAYIESNNISDFMEYGADQDVPNMPTLSKIYKEILDILKMNYESVRTNEIRGGKYETIIEFTNNNSITVDTYSRNGQEHITENINSIKEFEETLEFIEDDEMEM